MVARLLVVVLLLAAWSPVRAGQFDLLAAGILAKYRVPPAPGPAPAPAPKPPSGDCSRCSGTGKLGDGTVWVICPACKGTGKATAPPPLPTPPAILPPAASVTIPPPAAGVFRGADGRLYRMECGGGACRAVPVR